MNTPLRITVTGAAGQIGYALLFRIASGQMLGPDQPVLLQLLEVPPAMPALSGVAMELEDCAFPLLADMVLSDDPVTAMRDTDFAILVGSKPRGKGMERSDLLGANGSIFRQQGQILNEHAARGVRVLVVGNPANTNAWVAAQSAPDLPQGNFTALTRLDHNRGLALLAARLGEPVSALQRLVIWGNHSNTQYPDISHLLLRGVSAADRIDPQWYRQEYIPRVAGRGAEIIEARGVSSAASAANAALGHMRDWVRGVDDDWCSMVVPSDGSYGVPEGLMCSFPVICQDGGYRIIRDLELDEFSKEMLLRSQTELESERDIVKSLL